MKVKYFLALVGMTGALVLTGCGEGSSNTEDGGGYRYDNTTDSPEDYWQKVTIDGVECIVQTTDDLAISCDWAGYNSGSGS